MTFFAPPKKNLIGVCFAEILHPHVLTTTKLHGFSEGKAYFDIMSWVLTSPQS